MYKKLSLYAIIFMIIFSLQIGLIPVASSAAAVSEADQLVKKLIVLPAGNYDKEQVALMSGRLAKIHLYILRALVAEKVKIKLTIGPITDTPEMAMYKGVTPRGWEGTGKTWDDVPGSGGNPVVLRIGYSMFGKGHGSINLELHETSHVIDSVVFNDASQSEAFKTVWKKELKVLYGEDPYYQNVEEYFAETMAIYYLANFINGLYPDGAYVNRDGEAFSRAVLKSKVPLTYAYFQKLELSLAKKYAKSTDTAASLNQQAAPAAKIVVQMNGKAIPFADQQPVNLNGRVLVPVKAILDAIGATVAYNPATKELTASKGKTTVRMTLGNQTAYVNDQLQKLDQAPITINQRTMLPVGFLAKAFGVASKWDSKLSTLFLEQ